MNRNFKPGDRVRVLRHRNWYGRYLADEGGLEPGSEIVIKSLEEDLCTDEFSMYSTVERIDGVPWLVRSDDIEKCNEATPNDLKMISDYIRPFIREGQDPSQADNGFGIIGFIALEQQRALIAEEELSRLAKAHLKLQEDYNLLVSGNKN